MLWCWIEAHVPLLTFLVLAATLGVVVAYTRAAFQQAEGVVKPCVVPAFHKERIGEDQRAESRTPDPRWAQSMQEKTEVVYTYSDPKLVLRNIGNGLELPRFGGQVMFWDSGVQGR